MARLIDADEVIAMLLREANHWSTFEMVTENGKSRAAGISMGYRAAAEDIEKMMNEQAEGNVPTDSSE